jgi:hypothetical protein
VSVSGPGMESPRLRETAISKIVRTKTTGLIVGSKIHFFGFLLFFSLILGGLVGRTGPYVSTWSGLVCTLRPDQTRPFRSLNTTRTSSPGCSQVWTLQPRQDSKPAQRNPRQPRLVGSTSTLGKRSAKIWHTSEARALARRNRSHASLHRPGDKARPLTSTRQLRRRGRDTTKSTQRKTALASIQTAAASTVR